MASVLEDAALGRALRELAESADRARSSGLLLVVTKIQGDGWRGTVRVDDAIRPLPTTTRAHDDLAGVFLELVTVLNPDPQEGT